MSTRIKSLILRYKRERATLRDTGCLFYRGGGDRSLMSQPNTDVLLTAQNFLQMAGCLPVTAFDPRRPYQPRPRPGGNRSSRAITHTNPMSATWKKRKLRALSADKRQCSQCHITADSAARTDCSESGCPDFKVWEKKERGRCMSIAIISAKEASLAMGVALRAAKETLGDDAFVESMLALITLDVVLNRAMRPATGMAPTFLAGMSGPDRKCLAAADDTWKPEREPELIEA